MSSADHVLDQQPPERFVPATMAGELAEAEHLVRYRWAARFVAGRRVLDAACGTAYGSVILHQAGAASVMGVDIAEAVIAAAQPEMPAGVELRVGDVERLDLDSDTFDVVVCFETIEHVRDREAALAEFRRVLAPNGLLLISSPNRDGYVPGNPHHVHEYSRDEFVEALTAMFPHVEVLSQEGLVGAAILREDDFVDGSGRVIERLPVTKAVAGTAGRETYLIGVASDAPLPTVDGAMVTTGLVEVRRWMELYAEQQDVLRRQREHIENVALHQDELREARRRLREAEQRLAVIPALELDARITRAEHERLFTLQQENAALEARVAELEGLVTRAEGVYKSMQSSVSWRVTKPLRALRRR